MTKTLALVSALFLAGCVTDGVTPQPPITVEVPIVVSCVKEMPLQPDFPDSDKALKSATSTFDRIKMLVAGRILRIAYQTKLEAALAACK